MVPFTRHCLILVLTLQLEVHGQTTGDLCGNEEKSKLVTGKWMPTVAIGLAGIAIVMVSMAMGSKCHRMNICTRNSLTAHMDGSPGGNSEQVGKRGKVVRSKSVSFAPKDHFKSASTLTDVDKGRDDRLGSGPSDEDAQDDPVVDEDEAQSQDDDRQSSHAGSEVSYNSFDKSGKPIRPSVVQQQMAKEAYGRGNVDPELKKLYSVPLGLDGNPPPTHFKRLPRKGSNDPKKPQHRSRYC